MQKSLEQNTKWVHYSRIIAKSKISNKRNRWYQFEFKNEEYPEILVWSQSGVQTEISKERGKRIGVNLRLEAWKWQFKDVCMVYILKSFLGKLKYKKSIIFGIVHTNLFFFFESNAVGGRVIPCCCSFLFDQDKVFVIEETIKESELYLVGFNLSDALQKISWIYVLCLELDLCLQPCVFFL